jgi:hypothetical protein
MSFAGAVATTKHVASLALERESQDGVRPTRALMSPERYEELVAMMALLAGKRSDEPIFVMGLEAVSCPDCELYVPSALSQEGAPE